MEKDSGHYCYEPYPTSITTTTKNSTKSLKRDNKNKKTNSTCKCFGEKSKSKSRAFIAGLATNLGICILLFGYTLIGSIIFLAIEGGTNFQSTQHSTQILATTSMATTNVNKQFLNHSAEMKAKNDEARARTVESIWDITVNLNILYRDNWTRLAAQEITRFQDELLKTLSEELAQQPMQERKTSNGKIVHDNYEWSFAKAFLYSLTVLTTIGYGSIAPRTSLGKAVTMGYAMLGIPLTLLYLSSIGSILSRVARGVFSRTLCCCLCSNCGYCCYDEKRMAEKERRMKKKRQQLELQQQIGLQEPFYVRSNTTNFTTTSSTTTSTHNNLHSPIRGDGINLKEIDSISSADNESKSSMHGLSILAPVLLCLIIMFIYICLGTFILYKLENWSILNGFYFCFMSLTTIGFGDMVPGTDPFINYQSNITIWFCSIYIMSGMALTAMCFNVVHDEIVHRIKHHEKMLPKLNQTNSFQDELNINDPYCLQS